MVHTALVSNLFRAVTTMAPTKRGASTDDKAPAKRPSTGSVVIGSPLKRVKAAIREQKATDAAKEEVVLDTVEGKFAVILHLEQPSYNMLLSQAIVSTF
jgi:hypothetical protein